MDAGVSRVSTPHDKTPANCCNKASQAVSGYSYKNKASSSKEVEAFTEIGRTVVFIKFNENYFIVACVDIEDEEKGQVKEINEDVYLHVHAVDVRPNSLVFKGGLIKYILETTMDSSYAGFFVYKLSEEHRRMIDDANFPGLYEFLDEYCQGTQFITSHRSSSSSAKTWRQVLIQNGQLIYNNKESYNDLEPGSPLWSIKSRNSDDVNSKEFAHSFKITKIDKRSLTSKRDNLSGISDKKLKEALKGSFRVSFENIVQTRSQGDLDVANIKAMASTICFIVQDGSHQKTIAIYGVLMSFHIIPHRHDYTVSLERLQSDESENVRTTEISYISREVIYSEQVAKHHDSDEIEFDNEKIDFAFFPIDESTKRKLEDQGVTFYEVMDNIVPEEFARLKVICFYGGGGTGPTIDVFPIGRKKFSNKTGSPLDNYFTYNLYTEFGDCGGILVGKESGKVVGVHVAGIASSSALFQGKKFSDIHQGRSHSHRCPSCRGFLLEEGEDEPMDNNQNVVQENINKDADGDEIMSEDHDEMDEKSRGVGIYAKSIQNYISQVYFKDTPAKGCSGNVHKKPGEFTIRFKLYHSN